MKFQVYANARRVGLGLLTFENVAKTLIVHLRRAVENVAALPKTGGKVLRCFGFTRASWTGRGTAHLQMQRLRVGNEGGRSHPVLNSPGGEIWKPSNPRDDTAIKKFHRGRRLALRFSFICFPRSQPSPEWRSRKSCPSRVLSRVEGHSRETRIRTRRKRQECQSSP